MQPISNGRAVLEKPEPHPDKLIEQLRSIQHVALDMDGTIYCGNTLFPFTKPFLKLLSDLDIGFTCVTNNSSKSAKDYVAHLRRMGVRVTEAQILISTHLTIKYMQEMLPLVHRLFLLGSASMGKEILAAGFSLAADSARDEPDAVLVGFDTGLAFSRLCRAAYWIKRGKPFIASHMDRVCPTDQPTLLLDCGSICAALGEATGRQPDAVLGKPNPRMLRELQQRHELRPENLAMVGDRLYTDMDMARLAGVLGVLVLTGEATASEAANHRSKPDLVATNLAHFGDMLKSARNGCR